MRTTFLNRVEIVNQQYETVKVAIENAEQNIADAKESVAQLEPVVTQLQDPFDMTRYGYEDKVRELDKRFHNMVTQFFFENFPNATSEHWETVGINRYLSFTTTMSNIYRGIRSDHDRSLIQITDNQRALARYRETLSELNPNPIMYIKDQIDAQLMQVEGVVPGSVYISKVDNALNLGESTAIVLHWRMEAGLSSVNSLEDDQPPPWFHVDKIHVPYTECEVQIDLKTKQCRIVPIVPETAYYSWQGTKNVHPHILEHNKPCFGDFSGPYTEAVAEQRWVDVASIIRLFLSNIDAQDSAGKHWLQFFAKKFADRYVMNRYGQPNSIRGYKHYFQNTDGEWYTKLSKNPVEFQEITAIDLEELERQRTEMNMRPRFGSSLLNSITA